MLRHYEVSPVADEKGRGIGERAKAACGKPAYDPRMMTTLLVYGYVSEENLKFLQSRKIGAYVAAERLRHHEKPPAPRGPIPHGATRVERMRRKLRTVAGKAVYALRKITVEPVFSQIRTRGLIRFWLRGLRKKFTGARSAAAIFRGANPCPSLPAPRKIGASQRHKPISS